MRARIYIDCTEQNRTQSLFGLRLHYGNNMYTNSLKKNKSTWREQHDFNTMIKMINVITVEKAYSAKYFRHKFRNCSWSIIILKKVWGEGGL